MMVKRSIIYGVSWVLILSCRQPATTQAAAGSDSTSTSQNDTMPASLYADTHTIAILTVEKILFSSFKDSMPAIITQPDMETIETLLTQCAKAYNTGKDSTKLYTSYIDLKKYKRQYAAYTNAGGDKKVFINCFCAGLTAFKEWKEKLVEVDDGGICFFNVTINITKKTCGPVLINGPG